MKGMILFIDDEVRRMKSYVEELEFSGYEVEFKSDVDSALNFLADNEDFVELVILDIMMPAGNSFDVIGTEYGLRTGISFHHKIRENNATLPVLVFTNVSYLEISSIGSDMTFFVDKTIALPNGLVKMVSLILEGDQMILPV